MKIRFCCMIDGKDICGTASDCIADLLKFRSRYISSAVLTAEEPTEEFFDNIQNLTDHHFHEDSEYDISMDEEMRIYFHTVHAMDLISFLTEIVRQFEN